MKFSYNWLFTLGDRKQYEAGVDNILCAQYKHYSSPAHGTACQSSCSDVIPSTCGSWRHNSLTVLLQAAQLWSCWTNQCILTREFSIPLREHYTLYCYCNNHVIKSVSNYCRVACRTLYNVLMKLCKSVNVQWLNLLVVFRREVVILDWKKWNDLRDDLNDDELLSVRVF